jgi:alpha-glucosidase (family GH31 glycosyl hydrolase)
LVSVVWAGDQQTDFSLGDGIKSIVPMGIGLGVTGFPYFGHDIAGYMSEFTVPVSKELFYRWTTLGALSPVMRTHHGRSARENWNWESDAGTTEHFRRWASLHMQLYPYLSELSRQAHATGAPLFRPLALDYPDFEEGWTSASQFMLGDRIVVAPILEEGATERSVSLPPGDFYPLLGGAAVAGQFTAAADIGEIPAFVPAGGLLVLLPASVDTLTAEGDQGVVTLADAGSDRVLWLYPGGDSTWQEGSAMSYEWTGSTSAGAPTGATFEGSELVLQTAPTYFELAFAGPGTLRFDDGSTLVVSGGAADRSLLVRLYR